MKKLFFCLLATCFVFNVVQSQCTTNDLVYPANSSQHGYYKTSGKIESAGTIDNQAHFKASERVQLKSGFSVNSNTTFRADNSGCELSFANWDEGVVRTDDLKIQFPDSYNYIPTTSISSSFVIDREDHKIVFGGDYARLNVPNTLPALTEPLPLTYTENTKVHDQQQIIYSATENGQVNGMLYYFQKFGSFVNPHTGADIEAIYFQKYGNYYIKTLRIRYPLPEENEVISILETVKKWPLMKHATIYWSSIAVDGCNYEIDINGEYYKAVNEEIIDPVLHSELPKEVLLTYNLLPNDTSVYCFKTDLQSGKIYIKSIDELPANNSCNNVYYDTPFTAAENETYCFADGNTITINAIQNHFCDCITCNLNCDCAHEGYIQVESTLQDANGNLTDFTYYNGNVITLPTLNWNMQLLEYPGDGCGDIDEVLFNITQN